jgi:hypothetical protein
MINVIIIMASLTEQMELLQKQQVILTEKIKADEERKRKDGYTIQTLQKLNEKQRESITKYKRKDGYTIQKSQQTNQMTSPRFEVILEILKKQDARIQELEEFIELI